MGRIIINNNSDLTDIEAMRMAINVMKMGRVSNEEKQYCYLSVSATGEYHIVSDLRKKSDSFTIYKVPKQITINTETK